MFITHNVTKQCNNTKAKFLRATAVPAGTAEARISYGNSVRLSVCLSVCPSVTTRYGFNAR